MKPLIFKPLFHQFSASSRTTFIFLYTILLLSFSNSSCFPLLATADQIEQPGIRNQAVALLKWKVTFDNQSQSLLWLWTGDDPCDGWIGLGCNNRTTAGGGSFVTYISLQSLSLRATENFDSKHIIGTGGCGTIYKAELPTGEIVTRRWGAARFYKFENEIRALTETRHVNIVKLYGFCSHPRHMLLVYEFLEGGSLRNLLKDAEKAPEFDWNKRVNAIKGIANALSYMHHDCSQPIIHRDLSSNNVLFNSEYVAHISDFGIARIIKPDSSNWTSYAGTYRYSAPELEYSMEINEKCDVYSFGIVTLEVIMGKHPGDFVSALSFLSMSNVKV